MEKKRPLVALESTLISFGLPSPYNLQIAERLEEIVYQEGAVGATVAVLDGQIRIGLEREELERLANDPAVRKVSRRDLPLVVGMGLDGATTVSATMYIAHLAGIDVFATGGVGGVHRGHPFDVSADLLELGRTPITVVSAGVKAILDLELTREVLETQGVPVIGYGSEEMAAFYSRRSGLPADVRVDSPEQVARIICARNRLGLKNGLLVTVPVPAEDEIPAPEIEYFINRATHEAEEQGVTGAALTPFVLDRLAVLTDGRSVRTNIRLLENNARVAAQVALALRALRAD
jgi:pseudouridine-5'-phosphate glycosidase